MLLVDDSLALAGREVTRLPLSCSSASLFRVIVLCEEYLSTTKTHLGQTKMRGELEGFPQRRKALNVHLIEAPPIGGVARAQNVKKTENDIRPTVFRLVLPMLELHFDSTTRRPRLIWLDKGQTFCRVAFDPGELPAHPRPHRDRMR